MNTTWPAIDTLYEAHQSGLHYLDQLSRALESLDGQGAASAQAIEEVLHFFDTELAVHFRHEEQALFVVLERVIGRAGPIGVMLDEHQALQHAMSSFRQAWAGWKAGEKRGEELQRLGAHIVWLLGSHIDKENNILFTMAEQNLQPALKVEVTERMKAVTA